MNQRQLGIGSIVLVAAIAVAAVAWYAFGPSHRVKNASQAPAVGKAQVGQPAPEFSVATTAGLFDLKGTDKPVFLEVFATWCPHCQRETAVIDRLYNHFKSRVDFVGVSGSDTAIDGTTAASQLDVLKWAQRFNVQYPVAYDASLGVAAQLSARRLSHPRNHRQGQERGVPQHRGDLVRRSRGGLAEGFALNAGCGWGRKKN